MPNEVIIYSNSGFLSSGGFKKFLKSPLIMSALIGYLLVISLVLVYLGQPKTYRSEFSLMLPGNGSNSNVVLDNVGQVSSSSPSAFGHSHNPRSNYKAILMSSTLRSMVSNRLGLSSVIEKPKIQLLEQTSIINLSISSKDAKNAQLLAWTIYEEFQKELNRLRTDETVRRDEGIERVLDSYREKLNVTRMMLVDFKQNSLLVSQSQVDHLVEMLSKVRNEITFSQAELDSTQNYVQQLSNNLGVSVSLAAQALTLQSDSQFNGYLKELDRTASQLSQYQSQWGKNHPKVLVETERFQIVLAHLKNRSTDLVGYNSAEILHGMNLQASANLSGLYSQLLEYGAKQSGLIGKINDLESADKRLEDQLRVYSRESAQLERIEREYQRAEAIYNSAAARLEAGQTDIFASYPLVQLISSPSLSFEHDNPKQAIAIAAGVFGIAMITLAVLIIWQRKNLLKALLKKD